ncbi:MAG: hypothetical protein V1895_02635 [Parcubacteria group bacterium]
MLERLKDAGLYLAVKLSVDSPVGPTQPPGGTGTTPPTNPPGGTGTTTETVAIPDVLPKGDFAGIITNVINWGLGIAGSVATLMLFVGGFMYVAAAGDEQRIERAKKIIKGAIIGIIVMLMAGVIVNTINYALFKGATGRQTGTQSTAP